MSASDFALLTARERTCVVLAMGLVTILLLLMTKLVWAWAKAEERSVNQPCGPECEFCQILNRAYEAELIARRQAEHSRRCMRFGPSSWHCAPECGVGK